MNEAIFFNAISWIGLVFCIGAFFVKEIKLLRLCTLVGCTLLAVYYAHIDVPQGLISNLMVLGINLIFLMKRTEQKAQENAEYSSQCDSNDAELKLT